MVVGGKNSFTHCTMAGGTFNLKEMYQMTSKKIILTSEEYVKALQQADAEWEAQTKNKDWTFEVLKDPRLRTRPSERERYLVFKNFENDRIVVLKNRSPRAEIKEGYVFDRAELGANGFSEFWIKGAVNE
jgi:hypothetical protein